MKVRDGLGRPLPLVAIGGITIADVPSLMSTVSTVWPSAVVSSDPLSR